MKFVFNIKVIIKFNMQTFAAALASISATQYNMDVAGVEQFVAGLIMGFVGKDDLPEIQACLQNAGALEAEITNAISDFSKGDLNDIIKGIEETMQIIKELPEDLKTCQDIDSDLAKIEAWAKIFTDPTKLVMTLTKNLLANWSKVVADVSKTESDWNANNFYDAGDDVAELLVLSVGPVSQPMADVDWQALQKNLFLF